jgi:signal transduction histidine kinase
MLAVIGVTAVIRIGLWLAYQAYEVRQGHVVFHEQISEVLILLLVEVMALAVLGVMLWNFSRLLLSPLRSVSNAAQLISQGALRKRIRTSHLPEGELLDVASALNTSFDRYQEALDRIARFSGAASHQLRTPLATIRSTVELALTRPDVPAEQEEALLSILEETEHLNRVTEQLLLLSRMEVEHLRDQFVALDLNDIVRKVVDVYEPVTEERRVTVRTTWAASCSAHGDETLLFEAVMNLVDNAVKWCGEDGEMLITTGQAEGRSTVEVADSGPGIDPEAREHLFDRFSRDPRAFYKGSGLGLSIVAEVVKLHDGTVTCGTRPGGGAVFTVTLPSRAGEPPQNG